VFGGVAFAIGIAFDVIAQTCSSVSTNRLIGNTLNFADSIPAGSGYEFWRVARVHKRISWNHENDRRSAE